VISAIIPTRGGDARLARNLPSVRASLEAYGTAFEVVVVDDGAELGDVPAGARLVSRPRAGGYGPAVNAGVEAASGEFLLVLNDDVRLEEATVKTLAPRGIFATVPAILSPLARCGDEGGKAARLTAGLVEIEESPSAQPRRTFYPVGCCYLCRRRTFLDLGGYDDVYAPFFWEDVDLGYRAWKQGLASIHVPTAICHHEGSATIGERPMTERETVWQRNWALFHLRNLQDPGLRSASLGAWAAYALFDDRTARTRGLAEALERFGRVGRRREKGRRDRAVLSQLRAK
jgi:GT2 family glycosyltransferase